MMAFDAAAMGIVLPGALTRMERRMRRIVLTRQHFSGFKTTWPGAVGGVDMVGEIEADFDDFPLPLDAVVMWYD